MSDAEKQQSATPALLPGARGNPGRPKGIPNKLTVLIRDAIRDALALAGQDALAYAVFRQAKAEGKTDDEAQSLARAAAPNGGAIDYLRRLANEEPRAFAGLLAKLLPAVVVGEDDGPVRIERIERVLVRPQQGQSSAP